MYRKEQERRTGERHKQTSSGHQLCSRNKIKYAIIQEIEGNTIINFDTKHYGNGFVVAKKKKNTIFKCCKVSDSICSTN